MMPASDPVSRSLPTIQGEFVPNLLQFIHLLRRAGLSVSTAQSLACLDALVLVSVGDREQVYHAARATLITRRDDLAAFDLLFNRVFGDAGTSAPPVPPRRQRPQRPRRAQDRIPIATLLAARVAASDPEIDASDRSETFTPAELLQRKAFSTMSEAELDTVERVIREFRWQVARRQTHRWSVHPRGTRPALRRALRYAARSGGVPPRLPRQRRRTKPRPIVLLADVSGSMERYSRLILQFFHILFRMEDDIEAFVFGTRLTHLTPTIRLRNIDQALDASSRQVLDWSGGTRIGVCLEHFNAEWARRVLRRGAIVVVVSDGWDRDDVSTLRTEMARLQRRCHRVIWLNPHLGGAGYAPRVEGMAAALPFIDDFLPIAHVQHLHELADRLMRVSRRRGARRGAGCHNAPDGDTAGTP